VELTSFTLAQIFNSEFQGIKTLLTAAITAVTASWFLMRWKKRLISSRYATAQSAGTAMRLNIIDKAATVAIILFGGILAIEMSGNNWNTLLAFGGIGGLALAFASQEIISNFFGGLMTYITQPFAIGDAILIPEKNIDGNIEELGWYTTKILTSEKKALYVPNAIFSKVVVVNSTRASHRRIRETIRLNYSDLPKVKAIITDIATWLSRAPRIDQVIAPTVFLTTFGTSAIEVCVTAYTAACSTTTFNLIKQDLLFAVSDIIGQHQAQFAYTPDK
jgi:MscS family membrane protein